MRYGSSRIKGRSTTQSSSGGESSGSHCNAWEKRVVSLLPQLAKVKKIRIRPKKTATAAHHSRGRRSTAAK